MTGRTAEKFYHKYYSMLIYQIFHYLSKKDQKSEENIHFTPNLDSNIYSKTKETHKKSHLEVSICFETPTFLVCRCSTRVAIRKKIFMRKKAMLKISVIFNF